MQNFWCKMFAYSRIGFRYSNENEYFKIQYEFNMNNELFEYALFDSDPYICQ